VLIRGVPKLTTTMKIIIENRKILIKSFLRTMKTTKSKDNKAIPWITDENNTCQR